MSHTTGFWESFDGTKLFFRYWPAENPKAAVYLVHGMGEHSGRYEHVASFFNEKGFSCIAFDLRGHGMSGGKRGHAKSYEAIMRDVDTFFEKARLAEPAVPSFLYGHSLGGNIVLNYALRRNPNVAGVIATSPWLRLTTPLPKLQLALAQVAAFFAPDLVVKTNLDPAGLSRNKAVATAYMNDELVHGFISVRFLKEVVRAGEYALDGAEGFPLPLLLVHGTDDPITSYAASKEFAARSPKAELASWSGLFHETHNEDSWKDVLESNFQWMISRISSKDQA